MREIQRTEYADQSEELARTSKHGRTQLINLFEVAEGKRGRFTGVRLRAGTRRDEDQVAARWVNTESACA